MGETDPEREWNEPKFTADLLRTVVAFVLGLVGGAGRGASSPALGPSECSQPPLKLVDFFGGNGGTQHAARARIASRAVAAAERKYLSFSAQHERNSPRTFYAQPTHPLVEHLNRRCLYMSNKLTIKAMCGRYGVVDRTVGPKPASCRLRSSSIAAATGMKKNWSRASAKGLCRGRASALI